MPYREELYRALERRRAILRARDAEVARARELRETAAEIVLRSREAMRRAEELLEHTYKIRRERQRLDPQPA